MIEHFKRNRRRHPPLRRLVILNGFGMTLGDGVIGLSALAAAETAGALAGREPLLVRKPLFGRRLVNQLYEVARPLAETVWFPYRAAPSFGFEERVDIREFAFDPEFRGVAMIDFFLSRLGIDAAAIPATAKRNLWLARALRPHPPRALPARYILVCPRAAMALRSMPASFHANILENLLAMQALPVITQGRLPFTHPRLIWRPAVTSLAELAALVSRARLIVSTDTAMVHLADAWSVPTLAFFVTHRPEWRARDYPFCRAIHLPADLPPAIEFARDAADLAKAEAAWSLPGHDLGWVANLLFDALHAAERAPAA
ncbi:MAG: glycosyltransferase family 9 protein [Acetobacteraceae bacterium]